MATRGFEFAYMIDGSGATPVIRDFTLGTTTSVHVGDAYTIQSDGYADEQTATVTEVTFIAQESAASTAITAGTTQIKGAIVVPTQVWRCSSDQSTATTAYVGYTKTLDLADQNTIDASDITNGSLILVDKSTYDADGNLIFYVTFNNATFGGTT